MMCEERQEQQIIKKKSIEWRKYKEKDEEFEIVDFSGLSLDSLPNPTLNLATISKLNLSTNNLQMIPESLIARLLNVVELDLHSNELKSLPNSIGCLSKLKLLNASGNFLNTLPKTIENCRSLQELNLNFNKLTKLPESLGFELTNLTKLSVNSNKLAYLPQSISNLTSLRVLDARLNCLRSLPDDLENLIKLRFLNVSQNFRYLDTLPYSIGLLFSLVDLDISYNNITSLPHSMGCLNKLQKLSVEGNPLTLPPLEVVERGLYAVKEFLCDKIKEDDNYGRKKKSWVGKLIKYGTFNGQLKSEQLSNNCEDFIVCDYRSINAIASPRHLGMFSPRRLLSPRKSFSG